MSEKEYKENINEIKENFKRMEKCNETLKKMINIEKVMNNTNNKED